MTVCTDKLKELETNLFKSGACAGNVRLAVVVNLGIDVDGFSGYVASLVQSHSCGDGARNPAAALNLRFIVSLAWHLTVSHHLRR